MNKTQYVVLPFDKVEVPQWSIKGNDAKKYSWLQASLEKYGQLTPLQVRENDVGNYEIITGRNIYAIMKRLGYDGIYCCNHGRISEIDAKRIALETDLHRFEPDTIYLAKVFQELSKHLSVEEMGKVMPLSEKAIEAYITYLDHDWEKQTVEYEAKKQKKKEREAKRGNKEPTAVARISSPEDNIPTIEYKRIAPDSFLNNL